MLATKVNKQMHKTNALDKALCALYPIVIHFKICLKIRYAAEIWSVV